MRPATLRRPQALLLDDDPAVLRLLGRTLSHRGAEVVAAADAHGGLALLLDRLLDLDVLIVDLDLPGGDAWSLLRLIRGAGGEEDLRVVVLADRPAPAVRRRLLAFGADAVADRADGPEEAARLALAAAAVHRHPARAAAGSAARPAWRWWRPSLPALPALAPAPALAVAPAVASR